MGTRDFGTRDAGTRDVGTRNVGTRDVRTSNVGTRYIVGTGLPAAQRGIEQMKTSFGRRMAEILALPPKSVSDKVGGEILAKDAIKNRGASARRVMEAVRKRGLKALQEITVSGICVSFSIDGRDAVVGWKTRENV